MIVLLFFVSWPDSFLLIWSKVTVTTVWARELVAFIWVAATVRLEVPGKINDNLKYIYNSQKKCRLISTLTTLLGKRHQKYYIGDNCKFFWETFKLTFFRSFFNFHITPDGHFFQTLDKEWTLFWVLSNLWNQDNYLY